MAEETDWVGILGAHPYTVTRNDGKEESVNIKPVDMVSVQSALDALKNHIATVELFTGKSKAWCKDIQPPSLMALYKECIRVNSPFFKAYKDGMQEAGSLLSEVMGLPTPAA